MSYKGTRNVAIYVFSPGIILNVRVYACVNDLTNIMSEMHVITRQYINIFDFAHTRPRHAGHDRHLNHSAEAK